MSGESCCDDDDEEDVVVVAAAEKLALGGWPLEICVATGIVYHGNGALTVVKLDLRAACFPIELVQAARSFR